MRIRSGPSLSDKILGRLPTGANVRVLNEYLGEDCLWHKIEILDPDIRDAIDQKKLLIKFKNRTGSLYCHGDYLSKIDGVPPSLPHVCDFKINPDAPAPDWKKVDPYGHSCFYSMRDAEYQTTVELPFQSEDELLGEYDSFEAARVDVLKVGVRKLLYYYNKLSDEETISDILTAFKGAYIPSDAQGFFLDKRPGSFMRFLVCFPAKYFDAINEKEEDLTKASDLTDVEELRSFHFAVSTFKNKIETVAKKMDKYAEDVMLSGVEVQFLDLKGEARRLRELPAAFDRLLTVNGYPMSKIQKEMTVEVGLSKEFNVEWVYLNVDDKKSFPLNVGIVPPLTKETEKADIPADDLENKILDLVEEQEKPLYSRLYPQGFGFHQVEPIVNSRTMAYLYFLDSMTMAIKNNKLPSPQTEEGKTNTETRDLTWSNFVQTFTFPTPAIFPTSPSDKKESQKEEVEAKLIEKRYKKAPGKAKTRSELAKENQELANPDRKLKAAKSRAKASENVGDSLFEDIEHILGKIVNLDDVYDQLLNKYSIADLSKLVLSMLSEVMPLPDLENLKFEAVLDMIPMEKVDEILSKLKSIDPKLYKKAKKLVEEELEDLKEKGAELDADLGLVEVDADEEKGTEENNPSKSKSGKSSKDKLMALKVEVESEPTAMDLTKKPSKTGATYNSPKNIGKGSTTTEISPTKVGKSQQNALGIDVDVDISVKGSGASILKKLPPSIRKQLKGPVAQLEKELDNLIAQKKDMIKKMLNEGIDEGVDFVKETIEGMIPDEIREAVGIDISSISAEVLNDKLNPRKPPKNPVLDMPDDFATSDPMASIVPDLEAAVEEALTSALMGIVKPLLKELKSMLDDLLKGKMPDFGRLKNHISPDALKEAFEKLGADLSPEAIEKFLEEVVGSLTGSEMSDLLEGKASESVKQHVKSVISHKTPEVEDAISSSSDIEKVFSTVGDIVGQDVIDLGREPDDEFIPVQTGLLCDDDASTSPEGINDYGNRLSDKRAQDQDRAEKERIKELAKKLKDLIDNDGQLSDFDQPSLDCPDNILQDIPALSQANKMVIDGLFSSVRMAFSRDTSSFSNLLTTKESRKLQPGDAGYIDPTTAPKEDGPYKGWEEKRCELENSQRSMTVQTVAPLFRKALRKKDTFSIASGNKWAIDFKSSAVQGITTQATDNPFVGLMEEKLKKQQDKLASIEETIQDFKDDGLPVPKKVLAEKNKLIASNPSEGDKPTPQPEGSIAETKQVIQEMSKGQTTPKLKTISGINSVTYKIPYSADDTTKLDDKFILNIAKTPDETTELTSRESLPSANVDLSPTETWQPSERVAAADGFTSFVLSKLNAYGIKQSAQSPFLDNLADDIYTKIFLDFVRKTAKQVSNSPLFSLRELEKIDLLPDDGSSKSACPPSEVSEGDLLDIYNLAEQIKEDYEKKCEPLEKEEATTSVLEDEVRTGVVKTTTRVFMLESLLKSIFCFSEWDAETLSSDKLFLDYVSHNMRNGLTDFNPTFYRDMCLAAKEIVSNLEKSEKELQDPLGVIDMDALLNEDNPMFEFGEEALKYLAMEQLPDLMYKFRQKLGGGENPINRRFTDLPAGREGSSESTPGGMPAIVPRGAGGWIRTIDVPENYIYGGNDLQISVKGVKQGGNKFFRVDSDDNTVDLNYPDLEKECGTFFIEKYIRVEDLEQFDDAASPILSEFVKKRIGGSEGDIENLSNLPHTSGVVNIKAWVNFIKEAKNEMTSRSNGAAAWSDAKISHFFKPWKYGLRLVWVPPMNNRGLFIEGTKTWLQGTEIPASEQFQENTDISNKPSVLAEKFKEIEQSFGKAYKLEENIDVVRREKAYLLQEQIVIKEKKAQSTADLITKFSRPVYTIPLISVEMPVGGSDSLGSWGGSFPFDTSSDIANKPESPFAQLKQQLLDSEEYKFLFEYVFPLPRIATLLTIYSANSISLSKPEVNNSFNNTKEACRSLFYTVSADPKSAWWEKKDENLKEMGGNAGLLDKFLKTQSPNPKSGPRVDLLSMALQAVPVLIRGVASQTDPHYGLVSKLSDAGVPLRKDWTSVPILWPATIPFPAPPFVGWGPPLTPLGMIAYSLPQLTGDKKQDEENKLQKSINKNPESLDETCEDNQGEE